MKKEKSKEQNTGIAQFIIEVYNAWDSGIGRFLNLLSVVLAIVTGLVLSGNISIQDSTLQKATALVTAAFTLFIWIGAVFMVWKKQKAALAMHDESVARFDSKLTLLRLSTDKYKEIILTQIENYKQKAQSAPEPASTIFNLANIYPFNSGPMTKQDYVGWVSSLENYLVEIQNFESEFGKTGFLFDLRVDANHTDTNIDVYVTAKGGKFMDMYDVDFPKYPISKYHGQYPWINNFPISIDKGIPFRTRIEVQGTEASCNLQYVKAGQPVLFMNELIFCFEQDVAEVEVTINSNGSHGNIINSFTLNIEGVETDVDITKIDSFKHIAGDFTD